MSALIWFLLPVLYAPFVVEVSEAPRWFFLSLLLPLLLFRARPIILTPAHFAGAAFLAWSAFTILWGPLWQGLDRLWHFGLLGMAFCIGGTLADREFRRLAIAFAAGVLVSLPLVIAQRWWAFDGILQSVPFAGLFANANWLAEAAAMSVAATAVLAWPMAVILVLAVLVPWSKGAMLALILTTWWWFWGRSPYAAILILAIAVNIAVWTIEYWWLTDSIQARYQLFANSLAMVYDRPWGWGLDGFRAGYAENHDRIVATHGAIYGWVMRPDSAHNDALTLLVDTGVPGLLLIALLLLYALTRNIEKVSRETRAAHYILVSFLALGLFAFPLLVPATAAFAAIAAGFLCGPRRSVRNNDGIWESPVS